MMKQVSISFAVLLSLVIATTAGSLIPQIHKASATMANVGAKVSLPVSVRESFRSVSVDTLDKQALLESEIENRNPSTREECTEALADAGYNSVLGSGYSALAFRAGNSYDDSGLNELVFKGTILCGDEGGYILFIFKDGVFINGDEGTYENWRWYSPSWERSGDEDKTVTFTFVGSF